MYGHSHTDFVGLVAQEYLALCARLITTVPLPDGGDDVGSGVLISGYPVMSPSVAGTW